MMMSYDSSHDPPIELSNNHMPHTVENSHDTLSRLNHSISNVTTPKVYARPKELCNDLVSHEVPTLIPEHTEIDNLNQPSNITRGRHKVVALTTDSRHAVPQS